MEQKNLIAAYKVANDNTRKVLRTLYPEVDFEGALKKPITERIKTFEDACRELGDGHPLVMQYNTLRDNGANGVDCYDVGAYLKLRIICTALNDGWEPQFTKGEVRWHPWHILYSQCELDNMSDWGKQQRAIISTENYKTDYCGFAFALSHGDPSHSTADIGSRLCFKSCELAQYAGRQFIKLYADLMLIRK